MDASDPETRESLEHSLKDLAWMRQETKRRQAEIFEWQRALEAKRGSGQIDELHYQTERVNVEASIEANTDTLRMLQRQRALITSWLMEAES